MAYNIAHKNNDDWEKFTFQIAFVASILQSKDIKYQGNQGLDGDMALS